jgi:3',5'-cyclic-AMP phosphodiesterase
LLIAQITDIHLGFDPGNPAEFNRKRLDQVLRHIANGPNKPDMLLATGDLVDLGDQHSYRRLRNAFSMCDFPVHMCLGNHDDRANFSAIFPEVQVTNGFVQYEIAHGGIRLLVLDTLEPGRHGGGFCKTRAAWLRARLDEDDATPTIVVLHHPPIEVGIEWMNTHPGEQWVANLIAAIADAPNIKAMLCGHVHRNIAAAWQGTTIAVCGSTAPQVTLDLRPIDLQAPDNRPMIIADAPEYALHYWNGRELVTHFQTADEHVMLAKLDKSMMPLVRQLREERP